MAQPANAFETYDALNKSIREDLSSIVEDVSPTETPFLTAIGRGEAKSTFHEWQCDALSASVDTNAVAEGDDATLDATTATTRYGNYTQISDKTLVLTGTQMAVDHAGIPDQKGYQLMRRSLELKRDMDKQMCSNKASVAGAADAATARQSGGYECFITTNDERGGGAGAEGGYAGGLWTAPTDGDQRVITEDLLQSVLSKCWDEGGSPTVVFCGSFNKRQISGFTGGSTRTDKSEDKRLTAAIDYYDGDFGVVHVVPSRQVRTKSVLVVDPTLWALLYLRQFQTHKLAKNGDAEKWQLLVEYTLRGNNEKGSGIIADTTTS
jgi:hypothetical protein